MRIKLEYPEKIPEAQGEKTNSMHMGQRQESNLQPHRYEVNMLTILFPWQIKRWTGQHTGAFTLLLCYLINV